MRDPRLGTPHEVDLPAGPLRYYETGDGPPIVFVHGYLVNANLWRKLVPLLADRFRCITVDWPLTAVHPLTYRALYQALRWPRTWRWRNTYGWLAKEPIDAEIMRSYITPVLTDAAIRHDGRKAIGAVDARYTQAVAGHLAKSFGKPIDLLWAADDRVFPVAEAQRYADLLGATLHTVPDSYTYLTEDQPDLTAQLVTSLLAQEA